VKKYKKELDKASKGAMFTCSVCCTSLSRGGCTTHTCSDESIASVVFETLDQIKLEYSVTLDELKHALFDYIKNREEDPQSENEGEDTSSEEKT
jgi:hypothetical protein